MTVVVSDTSPLHHLLMIGQIDILPGLFSQVLIPTSVKNELTHGRAPEQVSSWAAAPPAWLEIRDPRATFESSRLGQGERDAIALALETKADLVLIDDRDAARVARSLTLTVVGTLAVLDAASDFGLVDSLPEALQRLTSSTNFRVGPFVDQLMLDMIARHRDREASNRGKTDHDSTP